MVWRHLILLTLVAYAAAGNNTRCYECSGVSLPALCSHVTECTDGQICLVLQYLTASGLVQYNTGCLSKERCPMVGFNYAGKLGDCVECCDGDYCNNHGCATVAIIPSYRGPMCFRCDYEDAPDKCKSVTACDKGEVCMLTAIPIPDIQRNSYYRSSCMKSEECMMIESEIIGKKRGTLCHNCCTDDYCNDKCNHVSVSTPLMTSPVTSLGPESTTSSSNMPVTTSPPMMLPTKPTTSSPTTAESTITEASTVHVSTTAQTTPTPATTTKPTTGSTHTATTTPTTTTNPTTASTHTATTTPTTTTKPTTASTHTATTTPTTTTQPTTTLKPTTKTNPTASTLGFRDYCHHHHYHYAGHSHLCYHLHDEKRSWDDAANICRHEGGMLAVVDTQAKWNFLKNTINQHYKDNVYIGARDTGHPDNDFYWTNGARLTFNAWAGDQPDGGYEDCIYVSHTDHWHWHDANCANHLSFVCTIQHP